MKIKEATGYLRTKNAILSYYLVTALISVFPIASSAATLDLSVEYDAANVTSDNKFSNTTPLSGFCSKYPNLCKSDEFSITIPNLKIEKYFDAASEDLMKNHTSISLNGTPKLVKLRNVITGKEINANFRMSLISMRHNRQPPTTADLFKAMEGTGNNPSGGCSPRTGNGYPEYFNHAWGIPEMQVNCYRRLKKLDPLYQGDVLISDISIGYTLTLPDPMKILSGDYEGEVSYFLGEGQEIDFHARDYSDSEVVFKIRAKVKHHFNIDFAPGSRNISLSPKNGWSQWTNGGQVPQELSQEIPFSVTASSKFRVNMECGTIKGEGCGLQNSATNDVVPMNITLNMPGFQTENGTEIMNTFLTTHSSGHVITPKSVMVLDRRSRIKFSVPQMGVKEMLQSPGSTWRGTVTLLIDTEIE